MDGEQPLGAAPPGPALYFPGSFNVYGIGVTLPGYSSGAQGSTQYEWQFYQDLTWTRGKHQFRAGVQFLHIREREIGFLGGLAMVIIRIQFTETLDNFSWTGP